MHRAHAVQVICSNFICGYSVARWWNGWIFRFSAVSPVSQIVDFFEHIFPQMPRPLTDSCIGNPLSITQLGQSTDIRIPTILTAQHIQIARFVKIDRFTVYRE